MVIAVTADVIGSRRLDDRAGAQRTLDEAIARVENDLPVADRPLRPTVGDEQQGVYPTLAAALGSLLLLRLALPDTVGLRFGLGIGPIGVVPSEAAASGIPEGPGWWAAREAIDRVHELEQRAVPGARTWVVAHESEPAAAHDAARLANAYLLARDQLVTAMSERARRLTYGRCLDQTQRSLATAEGITQSAVSQTLAAAGSSAVVEGFAQLGLR
ncbi:SatD family protein [Microbacterium sp.]|uniref:SatD family protein n=1 Tax=Microbacterium sp. TaxID=51671 RepID=UPI003A909EE7